MNQEADIQTRRVCASIDTLAMTYLDGELGGEDLRELEVHLLECAPCRARVDAETVTLGNLRRALAAPPAPALLRARVARALDGEDRTARRRLAVWLLPGAAATAAVAALALFMTVRPPAVAPKKPVENAVLEQTRRSRPLEVQGAATNQWVQSNFDPNVEVPTFNDVRVDRWGARLVQVLDREAVQLFYRVTTPGGHDSDVAVVIVDARGLELKGRERVVDGHVLLINNVDGASVVSLRDSDQYAYIFTSTQLASGDLAELVVRSSLLPQIRDQEH